MESKPRIVYVMQEYPVLTQTFVENEILALEKLGYSVTRFPLRLTQVLAGSETNVVTVRKVLVAPKNWIHLLRVGVTFAWRVRAFRTIFKAEKFSVRDLSRQVYALLLAFVLRVYLVTEKVQVSYLHAHFLGRCLDVAVYASMLGGTERVSATGHAGDVTNPPSPQRLRHQVGKLDGVVCASKFVAAALETNTGRAATAIVHCGVAPQFSESSERNHNARLRILSVGRLVEKKGFADAVLAARGLASADASFVWRVIGGGPLESMLKETSSDLIERGHLEWLGAQPSRIVLSMVRDWADVFVLPCRKAASGDVDGIPVALMEAMAAGIPVIAGSVAGIPELVLDGVTGFLVDPGDPRALELVLTQVIENRKHADALAAAGRLHVEREFNVTSEAKKLANAVFRD